MGRIIPKSETKCSLSKKNSLVQDTDGWDRAVEEFQEFQEFLTQQVPLLS